MYLRTVQAYVIFPHAGNYLFEFRADGEIIEYRRFVVDLAKEKP